MHEYVGPTRQATYITFVLGDPPRLAAVANQDANTQAVYLWHLNRSDPTILSWTQQDVAWTEPVLAASPDGPWLIAGPHDRLLRWDVSADPPAGPVPLYLPAPALAARFTSPDWLTVVILAGGETAVQLSIRTVQVSQPDIGSPTPLPVSPDLAARLRRMSASDWRIQSVLSDDGAHLAVAPRELPDNPLAREAFVWDVGTGKPPRRVEASGHPCALSFSPDGSRLVIDIGTVYVHDTATLEVVTSWKAKYDAPRLAWSPDGKLLARTDNSTTVRVYEAATGRQVMAVGGKRGRLVCAAFSPDGLTLATATNQGPVRVWDVE